MTEKTQKSNSIPVVFYRRYPVYKSNSANVRFALNKNKNL